MSKPLPPPVDLNRIWVPITRLRFALAELSKQDITLYPLGDLLLLIQKVVKDHKEEQS